MKILLFQKKKIFIIFILLSQLSFSQVGIGTTDPKGILDIESINNGLLIPRVNLIAKNSASPVTNPQSGALVESTLVYNKATSGSNPNQVTPGYYYWNGVSWSRLLVEGTGSGNYWSLSGNSGSNNGTDYIGTSDAQNLDFRTNNIIRTRITQKGQIEVLNTGQSIFLGEGAGANDDLTNNRNSFIGFQSGLNNTTGFNNIGIGYQSLLSNTTGYRNTVSGYQSLYSNTTGFYNTASGFQTLYSNTTGNSNSAFGYLSLPLNSTGVFNTGCGYNSLRFNTTGIRNTAIGSLALNDNTTGNYNTAIGYSAFNVGTNFSNSIALGYGTIVNSDNQARIGNSATSSIGGFANWTNISDKRFKTNIKENIVGLDFIMKLRPVTYNLDMDAIATIIKTPDSLRLYENELLKKNELQNGFIAQEVELAAQAVGFNFHGIDIPKNNSGYYGLRYAEFVVPIVKAVQEQQYEIDKQNKIIKTLTNEIELLKIALKELNNK